MTDNRLSVTAVCPTFGRFKRLQDAIACFILQDYPGRMHLLIFNDAPIPLQLTASGDESIAVGDNAKISLKNIRPRFPTLGQKRQALADAACSDLIAHWEDDDLYLPWHFSTLIPLLQAQPEIDCIKPCRAWRATKPPEELKTGRWCGATYDGQMIYRRGTAIKYPDMDRRVPLSLIEDYESRGKLDFCYEVGPIDSSYVYRISDGLRHLSKLTWKQGRILSKWGRKNKDFGDGKPLLPDGKFAQWAREHMYNQFRLFAEGTKLKANADVAEAMSSRLMGFVEEASE